MSLWKTVCFLVVFRACGSVYAQADVPVRARAVDVIILDDGTRLLGVVKDPASEETVSILLRTAWLRSTHPQLFARLVPAAGTTDNPAQTAVKELSRHLQDRGGRAAREPERTGFVNEQIARLKASVDTIPELVLLKIPSAQIRRRLIQTAERRALACAALLNGAADPETISAPDLRRRVAELPAAGFVTGVTATTAARFSIAQHIMLRADRLFGHVSRIIRYHTQYISSTGAGQNVPADISTLVADMLRAQLTQLLTEKTAPPESLPVKPQSDQGLLAAAAAQIAERENADVVELTSLQMNPDRGTAAVTVTLYYRSSDDQWREVMTGAGEATSDDVTAEQQHRITQDPQVRQVFELFNSVGAASQMSKATAIGAVVQTAQQRARSQLTSRLASGHERLTLPEYVLGPESE